MNELVLAAVTLVTLCAVLVAASRGVRAVQCCAAVLAVISTIIAGKITSVCGVSASAATGCYAAVFLCTDLVAETAGRRRAFETVCCCLGANVLLIAVGMGVVRLSHAQAVGVGHAVDELFTFMPRLVAGGLLAFVVAQSLDVWLFDAIRSMTGGRHLWLRNCLSTMCSQAVDTLLVWHVAFGGTDVDVWSVIAVSLGIKGVVALCDTPFCYLGRRLMEVPGERSASGQALQAG